MKTINEKLEKLKNEAPIVEKILYYRQLAKLKSTYADGLFIWFLWRMRIWKSAWLEEMKKK